MISKGEHIVIHELYAKGYSIRAIARILKIDRKTISRRLKETDYTKVERTFKGVSKLDPYKEYILEFISKSSERIPSSVILEDIAQQGYEGGRSILQEFLKQAYAKRQIQNDPVVRFETDPGIQMQIDWTTIRKGKKPIYAFVAVLGYSRYTFVCFVDNMRGSTLVSCHEKAFLYFGGITKTILYDNMKTIVDKRDYYGKGEHKYYPEMLDLAKYCNFSIRLCRPYRAKTKGKVERFNSYLKGNFYRPIVIKLKDAGLEVTTQVLNDRINSWLIKANNRIHGTTRQKPALVFANELNYLLPYKPRHILDTNIPTWHKEVPQVVVQATNLTQYDHLLMGVVA